MIHLLTSSVSQAAATHTYRPFVDPLDLHNLWWWTLIPLALGISMAYKAVRLQDLSKYWQQSLLMTGQVVGGMIGLAVAAYIIVELIVYRLG
ncbi:MAG: hypothetical protein JNK58_09055 [Phycisphaerae bacterium]|nr:hypothetical protein [Phycisphaerae bacterium]